MKNERQEIKPLELPGRLFCILLSAKIVVWLVGFLSWATQVSSHFTFYDLEKVFWVPELGNFFRIQMEDAQTNFSLEYFISCSFTLLTFVELLSNYTNLTEETLKSLFSRERCHSLLPVLVLPLLDSSQYFWACLPLGQLADCKRLECPCYLTPRLKPYGQVAGDSLRRALGSVFTPTCGLVKPTSGCR